jgi:hypothetical protein
VSASGQEVKLAAAIARLGCRYSESGDGCHEGSLDAVGAAWWLCMAGIRPVLQA